MMYSQSRVAIQKKVDRLVPVVMCMASKTISNNINFIWLFALFLGQALLGGLIIITLGLTNTMEPFLLNHEYGLVIEGVVITAFGILGGIVGPIMIGLFSKDPIRFIIDEDYIEAVMFGGLIFKFADFVERHPREGIVRMELEEVVRRDSDGGIITTYSAKLIGNDESTIGTLRGISSTGVAEEIAETIKVELSRNFN